MRLNPNIDQVIADAVNWSETVRASSLAGTDDVMAMVSKIAKMPALDKKDVPTSSILQTFSKMGMRWQGKPILKHMWLAMDSLREFCEDDAILSAICQIKPLHPEIDSLIKLSKICKATGNFIKGSFRIDEFQEKRAHAFCLEWTFQWLHYAFLLQDLDLKAMGPDKVKVNDDFLVGTRATDVGCVQTFIRKLQLLDWLWNDYRKSPAWDAEVGNTLWANFSSLPNFFRWAAANDYWTRDQTIQLPNGQKGIIFWTSVKFQEFRQKLPNQGAMAFAELMYGLLTVEFDSVVLGHCIAHPDGGNGDHDGLGNFLRGSAGETILSMAFKKYKKALAGQAVSIKEDVGSGDQNDENRDPNGVNKDPVGDVEDPDEPDEALAAEKLEKKQLHEKVLAQRKNHVRFHGLPHLPHGPLGNFMQPAELNKILTNCPFHDIMPLPATGGNLVPAKSRAWILSADLFPGMIGGGSTDFRLPPKMFKEKEVPAALKALWEWVKSVRKPEDSIVICDGRFPEVRRYFDAELAKLGRLEVLEFWVIYAPWKEDDPRYPKRQQAFANCNRESILVFRPKQKKKETMSARMVYNACGEKSTYDMSYTGVEGRSLGELPKLTTQDKKKIFGNEVDCPLAYAAADQAFTREGVPFSWQETKSVDWLSTFFKDMNFDAIFDCTAGSAAAAIAAHYNGQQYDGLTCNPIHKTWCEGLMDQAMFAVLANGGAGATKEHISKVMHFFQSRVDEGMRMIKAEEADENGLAKGDQVKDNGNTEVDDDNDEGF